MAAVIPAAILYGTCQLSAAVRLQAIVYEGNSIFAADFKHKRHILRSNKLVARFPLLRVDGSIWLGLAAAIAEAIHRSRPDMSYFEHRIASSTCMPFNATLHQLQNILGPSCRQSCWFPAKHSQPDRLFE